MKLFIFTFSAIYLLLLAISYCQAYSIIGVWWENVRYIKAHDAFYPHPHLKDLKLAAKRGKILVVTLVVSAGLVVLISTALLRSRKDKEKADITEVIRPADLRGYVIAAANSGKEGLKESVDYAVELALATYAKKRGINWKEGTFNYSPDVIYNVEKDRVTVSLASDGRGLEFRAICGKIGASATANIDDDSIQSSIFIS